jgi:hypothetical protein
VTVPTALAYAGGIPSPSSTISSTAEHVLVNTHW